MVKILSGIWDQTYYLGLGFNQIIIWDLGIDLLFWELKIKVMKKIPATRVTHLHGLI